MEKIPAIFKCAGFHADEFPQQDISAIFLIEDTRPPLARLSTQDEPTRDAAWRA